MTEPTPEEHAALDIARAMVGAGIPVFAAPPCPPDCKTPGHAKTEFHLPRSWQKITPSLAQLNRWKPGWALAAIGGHVADVLDVDPRSGGVESLESLKAQGLMPRVFGEVATSGSGTHYYMSPLHVREANAFMPGLDYQGGDEHGEGRAFAWIPPTVRRSKDPARLGELVPYRWVKPIDLDGLTDFAGSDDSGEMLRAQLLSKAEPSSAPSGVAEPDAYVADSVEARLFGGGQGGEREFTEEGAKDFLRPHLDALRAAPIGRIEEYANRAAVALSHFVPDFWSPDVAYAVLVDNLSHTAYEPDGPYSSWTAEKFRGVLDGTRPPRDPWKAHKLEDVPAGLGEPRAPVGGDAVEALLAEMLSPHEIKDRPRPRALIKGLLNLDSESWIIGEPGSKKSFVALDMAGHVAAGRDWQGHRVHQGPVVMIVAEGAGGIGARIEAYEKLHGPMPDCVHILPRPVQAKSATAWAVLVEACRRLAPVLVVIDTQARVTVGLEENSATELGIYIEAVRAAREATGACVLTVHHTGRKGGDARGSSAIDGAQSTELKVESKGLAGQLVTEKQKDLPMAPPVPLKFESVQVGLDEDGDPITSLALVTDAFKLASGQEEPAARMHVPTFDEKDVWRRRILDALFLHAPRGLGSTRADVTGSLAAEFGVEKTKLASGGAYKTAWRELLALTDPEGELVILAHGATRFEIGSLSVLAGLEAELGDGTKRT